jgi:acetyl esterase/lipase
MRVVNVTWVFVLVLAAALNAMAADAPLEIPLYPGVAPGSENWAQKEVAFQDGRMIRNVVRPTLTLYAPDPAKANGTAMIVAPGGGFRFHSWQNEGVAVAQWLAERGVTAFVLKYRLLDTGESQEEFVKRKYAAVGDPKAVDIAGLASADGRQAVRLVRSRAAEWKVAPNRIGIMGFSAGGVVASNVATKYDAEGRPDFVGLIYGAGPGGEIPKDAPPLFVLCATDDTGAAAGCIPFYTAWKTAGRSVELHMYAKGGHGFGMAKRGLPIDHWIDRLGEWMDGLGLMKPAP